jgi:hypothetical protein
MIDDLPYSGQNRSFCGQEAKERERGQGHYFLQVPYPFSCSLLGLLH